MTLVTWKRPQLVRTDFQRTQLQFSNQIFFTQKWSGHFAVEFKDENGTNNGLLAGKLHTHFQLERPNVNANGELVYNSNRLTVSAGTGIDNPQALEKGVRAFRTGSQQQIGRQ